MLPFCASAARMCRCELIRWDMSFFPPCPILKLARHILQKAWALFTWLRDKKLNSSVQLLLNLQKYFFFFAGAPPDSSPSISTTDPTSRVYYLRRNLQRNWVVGCQVEVTNGLKFVYCVYCVGLMRFIQDLATVQPWDKILMWFI